MLCQVCSIGAMPPVHFLGRSNFSKQGSGGGNAPGLSCLSQLTPTVKANSLVEGKGVISNLILYNALTLLVRYQDGAHLL